MTAAREPELTAEQRERLQRFAEQHGRHWRQVLRDMWWDGSDAREPDGHLLRQVRNHVGPRRLDDVRL